MFIDLEKTDKRTKLLGQEAASLIDLYVKDKAESLDKIEDSKIKEAAKISWAKEQNEAEKISRALQGLCSFTTPLLGICQMACMIEAQPGDSAATKEKIADLNKYGKKTMHSIAASQHSEVDIPPELLMLLRLLGKALK